MQACIFSYIIQYEGIIMLKRKILYQLLKWKEEPKKKAMVVTGPRQCGKTTAVRYFGKENYTDILEINFKETPDMAEVFRENLDVDTLIMGLQFRFPNTVIKPKETLIFLDEIQECSEAITSLKFWTQDQRYDVICSGSLLGIDYKRASSYPVGYVEYIHMHSMDFEEYLWAMGVNGAMVDELHSFFAAKKPVPESVNAEMMRHFRIYNAIGGMPEAVQKYKDTKDLREVHRIQNDLLTGYRYDIAHYASANVKVKAEQCYFSIAKQLTEKENHKFQYSVVEKGASARKFENSTDWLTTADIAFKSIRVNKIGLYPEDYEDLSSFRLYTTDIGMLTGMRDFSFKQAIIENRLIMNSKGGFWEAAAADALYKNGYTMHFYKNETSSKREIDFLIIKEGNLVPVEVKGGNSSAVSLNSLMKNTAELPYAYKLVDGNVGVSEHRVITIPLYMVMFI